MTISVSDRQLAVVVGPNGSGKSTLLKAISGGARVFSGRITFDGVEITGLPTHKIAQLGLVYIPQTDNVFTMLSARENLRIAGYGTGTDVGTRVKTALDVFPMIGDWLERKAYTLSGGERQILAMAMALQKHPKMILFDEPTAHLAPKIAEQIMRKIAELRDRFNITIIVVEQNVRKVLEISDYAYILTAGRVAFRGLSQELLSNPELSKLYFSGQMESR